MTTDPTDNAMLLDSNHEVICRKKLDEERGNEWICGCFFCEKEREELENRGKERALYETNLAGPANEAVGVREVRDDLATDDESEVS